MALSKEEYLKRYLTGPSNEKKITKKKKTSKSSNRQIGLKILDDDVDFKSILPSNPKNSLYDDLVEDKPVVIDLGLDDRPQKVKELERIRSSKQWKVISQNYDESDDIPGGSKAADIKQAKNSDGRHFDSGPDSSPRQKRTYVDNVFPRRKRTKTESETPVQTVARRRDNLDGPSTSPALSKRCEHSSGSRSSKKRRHDSDESFSSSPPKHRHDSKSDSDDSTGPRRCNESDNSPPRRNIQDDSDNSPPRYRRQDNSPKRRSNRNDSDNSPPRHRGQDNSPPRRSNRDDSDNSPPRNNRVDNSRSKMNAHGTEKTDFGVGQPHQQHQRSSASLERDSVSKRLAKEKDLSRNHRSDAKLQDTTVPEVIYRRHGKKRDLVAEQKEKEMEEAKKAVMAAKYKEWNKGLKQKEMADNYLADALHEADKPLARYKDDHDLDMRLRDQDRDGDPMLAFVKKKTSKATGSSRPRYSGPQPPPNRYNLQPGYRWDGVDRSNGFEKKFFSKLSEDKAIKDIAYKWSTEDM